MIEFTYEVKTIIPAEQRIFVVYSLKERPKDRRGAWVYVNPEWSPERIKQNIIDCFPKYQFDTSGYDHFSKEVVMTVATGEATWTEPTVSSEGEATRMDSLRKQALAETDWTQLSDVNMSDSLKEDYKVYRQKLRDITQDPNWPFVELPILQIHTEGLSAEELAQSLNDQTA